VTWARNAGILKSEPTDTSLMPTAEFYAFVLKMLEKDVPHVDGGDVRDVDEVGDQGCQIFLGTTYQNGKIHTIWH
jgi:hypothetical protein